MCVSVCVQVCGGQMKGLLSPLPPLWGHPPTPPTGSTGWRLQVCLTSCHCLGGLVVEPSGLGCGWPPPAPRWVAG